MIISSKNNDLINRFACTSAYIVAYLNNSILLELLNRLDLIRAQWLVKVFRDIRIDDELIYKIENYDSFKWFVETFKVSGPIKIKEFLNDNSDIVQYVVDHNMAEENSVEIFYEVCRRGMINIARLMINTYKKSVIDMFRLSQIFKSICSIGHLEIVKLLTDHFDFDSDTIKGAFSYASVENHAEIDRYLIERFNYNKEFLENKYNTMVFAGDRGNFDIVGLFLSFGVNIKVEHYMRFFAAACYHGNIEYVKRFLNEYLSTEHWHYRLKIKCCKNGKETVYCYCNDYMIFNQSTDDTYSSMPNNPFWNACVYGHTEIAKLIVDHFNDTNIVYLLYRVCEYGHLAVLQWLLNEVICTSDLKAYDLFKLACENEHIEMVRWINSTYTIIHNNKFMHQISFRQTVKLFRLMIEEFKVSIDVNNIIDIIIYYNKYDILKYIIEKYGIENERYRKIAIEKIFINSCIYNDLNTIKWIANIYPQISVDFNILCSYCDIITIDWILNKFNDIINIDIVEIFRYLCRNKKIDKAEYLAKKYAKNEIQILKSRILHSGDIYDKWIMEWLKS